MKETNFLRLPLWFVRTTGTSALSKKVLVLLELYRDKNGTGQCNPKVETLAEDLGISKRSVRRALAELRESGFIEQKHGRRSDSYIIAPVLEWPKLASLNKSRLAKTGKLKEDKTGKSEGSVSLYEKNNKKRAAAAEKTERVPVVHTEPNGNKPTAAAAASSEDLNELQTAMAVLTGQVPGSSLMKRIVRLIEKAGGDIHSAVAFVASYRNRNLKSNGIWLEIFEQDYPAWIKRNRRRAEPEPPPQPKPMSREHAATMERIYANAKRIPK